VNECKPLPSARRKVAGFMVPAPTSVLCGSPMAHPLLAQYQGLTLVHVSAQLEHLWDTSMGAVGFSSLQR